MRRPALLALLAAAALVVRRRSRTAAGRDPWKQATAAPDLR